MGIRSGRVAFKVISHTPVSSSVRDSTDDKTETWTHVKCAKAERIKAKARAVFESCMAYDVTKKPTTAVSYIDFQRVHGGYQFGRKERTTVTPPSPCGRFSKPESSVDQTLSRNTNTNTIGASTKKNRSFSPGARSRANPKGVVRMRCGEIHRSYNNTCASSQMRFGRDKKVQPTNRFATIFGD